jgi:hypothetical protein
VWPESEAKYEAPKAMFCFQSCFLLCVWLPLKETKQKPTFFIFYFFFISDWYAEWLVVLNSNTSCSTRCFDYLALKLDNQSIKWITTILLQFIYLFIYLEDNNVLHTYSDVHA